MATASDRFLAREGDPELRIARSEGSYVFDSRGRKYVDFLMGWCVGNFGWGNAVMEKPARDYDGPDYVYPGFDYPPWGELAELLVSIAPEGLARCFRATGGSEAVDLALQAAMVHTKRGRFLSLAGSYHGNTIAALSVGAADTAKKLPNRLPGCSNVKAPLDERSLARIEKRLAKRDVAAFILEPISLNLGVQIPEWDALLELARLCRKNGTLLVADEVATGFGRTGKLFACDHYGLAPDILVVAKAMTDGVGGIGAMVATEKVARSMAKDGSFYSTYGWHPRSAHIAIHTLRYLREHRERLLAGVEETSNYFAERLGGMPFGDGVEVRAAGLAIGIDFGDGKRVQALAKRCRKEGLLVSPEGETVLLLPALNIDSRSAEEGLDILDDCLQGG